VVTPLIIIIIIIIIIIKGVGIIAQLQQTASLSLTEFPEGRV
jgi:hypothetical protein